MFRKKIIAIIIFGCFLNPINAQINPFTSEPSNGFERNVRSLLDRGKVEMKTTDRVEESTRQEVHVRQSSSSTKNAETINIHDKTKIINESNVGSIPLGDSSSVSEVNEFKRKWKNKQFTFIGKKNRGGGLSIANYYINGCDAVLSKFRLGETVKLSGTIVDRNSGGSGGEPIELKNCSVNDTVSTKIDSTPIELSGTKIGYLKDTSKIVGGGCTYYLSKEFDKKNSKPIASETIDFSGVVLNIDGKDVLYKGADNKEGFLGSYGTSTLRISNGKMKDCGIECGVKTTSFILNSSGTVTQTPVKGSCGS